MPTENTGVGHALAGSGSPCPEVELNKQTFRLGWPTQRAKQLLELLVALNAEQNHEQLALVRDPKAHAAKGRALDTALNAGDHRTYGSLWSETVDSPVGVPLFVASLVGEAAPDTPLRELIKIGQALWSKCPDQTRRALAVLTPPFVQALVEDAPIPPAEKAAKALELLVALTERMQISSAAPTG